MADEGPIQILDLVIWDVRNIVVDDHKVGLYPGGSV